MENGTLLTIFGLVTTAFILFLILAINFKWVLFGLNLMFKRFSTKNNIGLIFLRSKGNNFGIPKIADLNKNEEDYMVSGRKTTIPINQEEFDKGLFFGLPYKFHDVEDVKSTIGLYYHTTNEEGEPMYLKNSEGEPVQPVLSPIKNSVSISGAMLKALVDEKAISDALKDFLKKNQLIIILVAGNLLIAGVSAYFSYEIMSTTLPTMEGLVRGAIDQINNKLDLILEAVK